MGILGRILASPVYGPIKGVLWIARTIEEQANAEQWDDGKVTGALAELELDLELGKIDIEEYEARETSLLQQLKEIRDAKNK
jgi:hypothetical protein